MKYKASVGDIIFRILNYTLLILFGLTMLYPLVYTLSMSLSSAAEAARSGLHLYPRDVSLTAYKMVFSNTTFYRAYAMTIMRTVVGTVGALLVSAMYGYAVAQKELPFRKFFTLFLMLTMIFTGGTIPTYLVIKGINLLDNPLVYILPNLIGAYNVVILKNYFESIAPSIYESGRLDGAGEFTILLRIILPISTPVMATVALWIAVFHWNQWFDSMIYTQTDRLQVLQLDLQRIIKQNQASLISGGLANPNLDEFSGETVKSATIMVSILPILAVYPFIQKYFTKGIMLGSVKG